MTNIGKLHQAGNRADKETEGGKDLRGKNKIKTKKGQDDVLEIRMNSNARQYNKGAKHTRYCVTTPQEARQKLKGAKVRSEFNKCNGLREGGMYKTKGAGQVDMVQGVGAGQDGKVQGKGAGLFDMVQGVEAGLDYTVQGAGVGLHSMVQGMGAGLDKREQAGTKLDVSLKNKTDDTKDDSIQTKIANTKAKYKDDKVQDGGVGPDDKELRPDLYADHWGPTQDGLRIQVIIDGLTRYPEEGIIRGAGADGNIQQTKFKDTKNDNIHDQNIITKAMHKDDRVQGMGAGLHRKVQGEGAGLDNETIEDERTLPQAVPNNTKYGFDHKEDKSYEEETAPLHRPPVKDYIFRRDKESKARFQTLMEQAENKTTITPKYNANGKDSHLLQQDLKDKRVKTTVNPKYNGKDSHL